MLSFLIQRYKEINEEEKSNTHWINNTNPIEINQKIVQPISNFLVYKPRNLIYTTKNPPQKIVQVTLQNLLTTSLLQEKINAQGALYCAFNDETYPKQPKLLVQPIYNAVKSPMYGSYAPVNLKIYTNRICNTKFWKSFII